MHATSCEAPSPSPQPQPAAEYCPRPSSGSPTYHRTEPIHLPTGPGPHRPPCHGRCCCLTLTLTLTRTMPRSSCSTKLPLRRILRVTGRAAAAGATAPLRPCASGPAVPPPPAPAAAAPATEREGEGEAAGPTPGGRSRALREAAVRPPAAAPAPAPAAAPESLARCQGGAGAPPLAAVPRSPLPAARAACGGTKGAARQAGAEHREKRLQGASQAGGARHASLNRHPVGSPTIQSRLCKNKSQVSKNGKLNTTYMPADEPAQPSPLLQ
jgi:hypothetical protein